MPGQMDDFKAATDDLVESIGVLIARIKAMRQVGEELDLLDTVEQAKLAATRAEAARDLILSIETTAEQSSQIANQASADAAQALADVLLLKAEVDFAAGNMAQIEAFLQSVEVLVDQAENAVGYTNDLRDATEAAATRAEQAAMEVTNQADAIETAFLRIEAIDANMAAAVAAADLILSTESSLLAAVYGSLYSFSFETANTSTYTVNLDETALSRVDLTAPVTNLILQSSPLSVEKAKQFTIILRQGTGSNKVNWPHTVRWAYNISPALSYGVQDEDIITLIRCGTDNFYYGFFSGGAFRA